jgi:hypothetical protein
MRLLFIKKRNKSIYCAALIIFQKADINGALEVSGVKTGSGGVFWGNSSCVFCLLRPSGKAMINGNVCHDLPVIDTVIVDIFLTLCIINKALIIPLK